MGWFGKTCGSVAALTLAGGIAAAIGGSAQAADLPSRQPPVIMPPIVLYNWTGGYGGVNLGYEVGRASHSSYNPAGVFEATTNDTHQGVLGGGQLGYNWQPTRNLLLGIEADVQGTGDHGFSGLCTAAGCAYGSGGSTILGTARGRLGGVYNNWLFYGTGGLAYEFSKSTRYVTYAPTVPGLAGQSATANGNKLGWTGGGGFEWAFSPNWSFKGEYLYGRFHGAAVDYSYVPSTANRHIVTNSSFSIVRAGLNYHFNMFAPPAPIVAKY